LNEEWLDWPDEQAYDAFVWWHLSAHPNEVPMSFARFKVQHDLEKRRRGRDPDTDPKSIGW
jgi:hypothetical protein